MPSTSLDSVPDYDHASVGPFTGFGNFMHKELLDWWKSWRLIVVFTIPTLLLLLTVFFGFSGVLELIRQFAPDSPRIEELAATSTLLVLFQGILPFLYILMIIFSTMGLLPTEKSTGTLAWNLTKPLGRTGLLAAKWLTATTVLWLTSCVVPVVLASVCMRAYHGVSPNYGMMAPVVGIAFVWIGLWVLLILTISLGFQSTAAVGGIAIGFWIVPWLLTAVLGAVLGKDVFDWIRNCLATSSPFWAFELVADPKLLFEEHRRGDWDGETWKTVRLVAFAIWTIVLSAFSLFTFSRQEIGS